MKTNKLVLGTVQFGLEYGINNTSGKPSVDAIASILDLAFENNIRLLDTAEAYGDAQEVIGNYHRRSFNTFGIITKFSSKRPDLPKGIRDRVLENIETLRVNSLYSYMFHSYNDFENYHSAFRNELKNLKKEGLIGKVGVSVYTNEELEKLLNYNYVELVQLPFNLLDNVSKRGELLKRAKERGIEVHTRSAFLQGLFFKQPGNLPEQLKPLSPYLQLIHQTALKAHLDINALALNYARQQSFIDQVLIGVDTEEQLLNNLKSLQYTLSDQTMQKLNSVNVDRIDLLNPAAWNL